MFASAQLKVLVFNFCAKNDVEEDALCYATVPPTLKQEYIDAKITRVVANILSPPAFDTDACAEDDPDFGCLPDFPAQQIVCGNADEAFEADVRDAICESMEVFPTQSPTDSPTGGPSASPTDSPTEFPTPTPTNQPTKAPADAPTGSPTLVWARSTARPTDTPTDTPTSLPTVGWATARPTDNPSQVPTAAPEPPIGYQCVCLRLKTSTDYRTSTDSDATNDGMRKRRHLADETEEWENYPCSCADTPTPTEGSEKGSGDGN